LRRPRHVAVLTDCLRPRPPTVESYRFNPSSHVKVTSALRRLHPSRAPPTGLHSHTA
jgi:hypothetical protein